MDIYITVGLLLIVFVLFLILEARRSYKKKLSIRERIKLEDMIASSAFTSNGKISKSDKHPSNVKETYPPEILEDDFTSRFSENINKYIKYRIGIVQRKSIFGIN